MMARMRRVKNDGQRMRRPMMAKVPRRRAMAIPNGEGKKRVRLRFLREGCASEKRNNKR